VCVWKWIEVSAYTHTPRLTRIPTSQLYISCSLPLNEEVTVKYHMVVLIGILWVSKVVTADTLTPLHQSTALTCLGTDNCNLGGNVNSVMNGTASVSGTYGSSADHAQMTGGAAATSQYGALGATRERSSPAPAQGNGLRIPRIHRRDRLATR
jgi:hypothetical protein